jgi:putative addiction module killer protein
VPFFIGRCAPLHDFVRYYCLMARKRRINPPIAAHGKCCQPLRRGAGAFSCSVAPLSLDVLSPMDYIHLMAEVRQTEEFSGWLHRLRDANAVARIVGRIRRMEMGNPGDSRGVGHGILEMRIDYGPGYRIYYVHRGAQIVILLCGGDKRTQPKDIKRAQKLAETW